MHVMLSHTRITVGASLPVLEQGEAALLVEQLRGRDEPHALRRCGGFEVQRIAGQEEFAKAPRHAQLGAQALDRGGLRLAELNGHFATLEGISQR